jgi:hypothetical protein
MSVGTSEMVVRCAGVAKRYGPASAVDLSYAPAGAVDPRYAYRN